MDKNGIKYRPNHKQITLSLVTLKEIEERRDELGSYNRKGEFRKSSYDKAVLNIIKYSMRPKDRVRYHCSEIKNTLFVHFGSNEELAHIMHLFQYLILYSMKSLENHRRMDMVLNEVIKQLNKKG